MADEKELKDQRVPIMMTPSELEAIDDWMFTHRIRSRGEAIRRLCKLSLVAEQSDARKAMDGFMDASMALLEALEAMPELPENVMTAAAAVLARMLEAIDAQIADSAKTLPMTSGEGNIRRDLEQVDQMIEFLRGKSVLKLISDTPGAKSRFARRLAEVQQERAKAGDSKPER